MTLHLSLDPPEAWAVQFPNPILRLVLVQIYPFTFLVLFFPNPVRLVDRALCDTAYQWVRTPVTAM